MDERLSVIATEEELRVQEMESALSDARIEALEAEQERAVWEAR